MTDTGLHLINGVLNLKYARKSLEDKRQVASIPDQLNVCNQLEEKLAVKVPEEYIITDEKSAMIAHKRKGFDRLRMLIDLAVQKGYKVALLTWDAARLARNNEEGGYLVDRVRDEQIKIYTDLVGTFDETNYTMLNIHFGFGSEYSKKTSQGVLRNFKSKAEQGICPTAAHLGYRFNPDKPKGLKDVIKNPLNWDLCREWIELMLTGHYKIEENLGIMTARGLKNNRGQVVSRSKAYFFFKDIYNTGMFYYRGELHSGTHPPLLTMKEYNRIQDLIEDRGGKKRPLKQLAYMGMFKCGCCDATVTGERHTRHYLNGQTQEFCYYRSSRKKGLCKEKPISEKGMEAQVKSYIDDLELVPEFTEWLKKVIKRQNRVMYQNQAKEQEMQSKRLADITKRKFELREMKVEGYFPDDKDYFKTKEELLKQEQIIKQEVIMTDDSVWDSLFDDACSFITKIKDLYNSDDPVVKRMIVEIIGLNFILKGKKLKIEAKNAFIVMHQIKKELWDKNLWIEPQETMSEQPKQAISNPQVFSGAPGRS